VETPPIELVVFVGIPASGKSTFFRQRMAGRYVHVSLDNWRGKGNVRAKERLAIEAGLGEVAEGSAGVRGVVVDNTNTTARTRQRYFEYARAAEAATGRDVEVIAYFFDADLAGCLRRNQNRPAEAPVGTPYFVPPPAIANFHRILEPPTREEGFARIVRVRTVENEDGFVVEET